RFRAGYNAFRSDTEIQRCADSMPQGSRRTVFLSALVSQPGNWTPVESTGLLKPEPEQRPPTSTATKLSGETNFDVRAFLEVHGIDEAHLAFLEIHDQGMSAGAIAEEAHAAEDIAVGDTRASEDDL